MKKYRNVTNNVKQPVEMKASHTFPYLRKFTPKMKHCNESLLRLEIRQKHSLTALRLRLREVPSSRPTPVAEATSLD